MVKKDRRNKVQKLVQDGELQTNAAQITALRRILSEHPASGLTPGKLKKYIGIGRIGRYSDTA
ncbi:DUF935 domain-containing protein [Snodgrassella communis]|uniref:DUF935 domain-containing protein n=1 Tax=Snodgrassella communis TaxID=2946699 RepID=UPI002148002B|nr:DUF935 domain-containing protein [Snodgrassella communis]